MELKKRKVTKSTVDVLEKCPLHKDEIAVYFCTYPLSVGKDMNARLFCEIHHKIVCHYNCLLTNSAPSRPKLKGAPPCPPEPPPCPS
ncbi:hypothetical protein DPMN_145554 [Dreissena polymorpha]|uniref:Uncharacterized protein n=1 Tax=Dreissena polymorpha TaxID=45954 RepID=A0A9D4J163_DREPO|nr:hypothetical protein DPMN_145554 [Dreissena polymorpha]